MAAAKKESVASVQDLDALKSLAKVKVFHMAIGLDLIGSKTSISNKRADIDLTAHGIKMRSLENGRVIFIPFANVKGAELV